MIIDEYGDTPEFEMSVDCGNCELDYFQLSDHLIEDIKLLTSEVVRLRYALSLLLPKHNGEMLRADIVGDLYDCYYDYPAYKNLVSDFYDGLDPFDNDEFCDHLTKLAKGKKSTGKFRSLTFS